ncbi:DNA double-strand break repair ATPase Rad50 [Archaeoglobus sp.]
MKIEKVIVVNFRSHHNTRVEFADGINLIVGQNGSGKSSLLDAILVGLYWDRPCRILRKDDFQRIGSLSTEITVFFEKDGVKYQVHRNITRGLAFVKCYENGSWNFLDSGQRAVREWMERLIPYDVFVNAVYIRQGEIEAILESDESRDKLVRQVLGLDRFENAYNNLREVVRIVKDKIKNIEDYLTATSNLDELTSKMESELFEVEREIEKLEDEIPTVKDRLDEIANELKRYEELESAIRCKQLEVKEMEKELEKLKVKLENVREGIEKSLEKARELEGLVEELKEVENDAKLYERLEKLRKTVAEKKAKIEGEIKLSKQKLESVEKEIEELKVKAREVDELKKVRDECIAKMEELKPIVEDYETVRNLKNRLVELKKELEFDEEEILRLEQKIEEAEKRKEEIQRKLVEIGEKMGGIESRMRDLKKAILELKRAKGKCPVCGSTLTDEHRNRLIEDYVKELNEVVKAKKRLEDEEKELRAELIDIGEILKKERVVLRQKDILSQIKKVEETLKKYDVERIEKTYEEFKELEKRVQSLEGKISTLMADVNKLEGLKFEKADILKRLKELENQLAEVEMELKRDGFSSVEELDNTVLMLKPKYERYLELKRAKDELNREKENLEKLKREREIVERKIKTVEDNLNSLKDELLEMERKYDEKMHERLKEEEVSLREKLAGNDAKLKELKKRRDELAKRIEEFRSEKEKRRSKEKELEDLKKAVDRIQKIRDKVKQFKAMLREQALAEVGEIASRIFEELTDEKYSGVVVKAEENKVKLGVIYNGREYGLGFLSGGERVALGLAFRLALSLYLAGEMSLLILDEPTPFLDEERRRKLVEIMNRYLRKIPQVIVVSHDEELRESADRVIRVSLENGVSKVETCIGS